MDIKEVLIAAIKNAVQSAIEAGALPEGELPDIVLEVPPKKELGDFATNVAMQSARAFHMAPRKIAEEITSRVSGDWLDRVEIAGPGFINFFLKSNVVYDALMAIYKNLDGFGQLPEKDMAPIQVEYVSANPTGPLHVGHGRGAAAGSALVNVLRAAGYPVVAEYYINDAGNQMINIRKLEADLWESADLLRAGSKLTSNQYCMPVLGLIFLRYAYSRFKLVEKEILKDRPVRGGQVMPVEASDFVSKSALFLPREAQ